MASAGGDSSGEECGLQIDVGKTDGRQSKARGKGAKVTKPVNVSGFNYWPAKVGAQRRPRDRGGDHPVMISHGTWHGGAWWVSGLEIMHLDNLLKCLNRTTP